METVTDTPYMERPERNIVELRSFAERSDGFFKDVLLTNISYEGCEIRGADEITLDGTSELWVSRRGIAHVQVRWRDGDRIGCKFIS